MYPPTAIYFSHRNNWAERRETGLLELHKKTPVLPLGRREFLINYSLLYLIR